MSDRLQRIFGGIQYLSIRLLVFIARLSKSIWLFFPSILFIIVSGWCFWDLGQGKDVVVAFTENHRAKVFFCIAIAFWLYISWYSSRMIAYLKRSRQEDYIRQVVDGQANELTAQKINTPALFELPATWLEKFPRLIGYACLLSIEVAVLISPVLGKNAVHPNNALWVFILGLVLSWFLDNIVRTFADDQRSLARWLFYLFFGLFILAAVTIILHKRGTILLLLWLLLLLHAVFMFYINLRRHTVETRAIKPERKFWVFQAFYNVMHFLRIPRTETGYYILFNAFGVVGLIVYLSSILFLNVAWQIGPFPFVLVAFAILGGFGSIVAALSVKFNVNLHAIILAIALLLGSEETHYIRTKRFEDPARKGIYHQRQDLYTYFNNWINERGAEIDSSKTDYPVFFVLANGGASRSGYWTASVLSQLEDTTAGKKVQFSRHLFSLSGTSGGGVGVTTFFSLLHEREKLPDTQSVSYLHAARAFLKKDFLTFTLTHMLGPDYFKYIFHLTNRQLPDRAGALEQSMEQGSLLVSDTLRAALGIPFSDIAAVKGRPYSLPLLFINTTRMQDGNPGVISNITVSKDIFNNRVDVMDVLNDTLDLRLSTAAVIGARFPYISPAGRIDQTIPANRRVKQNDSTLIHYFVDGGYFDNSGAGVVQEMLRALVNYTNSSSDTILKNRVRKLHFTVLHITNGPVGVAPLNTVPPLTNDLLSPITTVLGAYDMQTTVNDLRLDNFIKDINKLKVAAGAGYCPIDLYLSGAEKREARKKDSNFTEQPYSMNWFISDTTLKRMDRRLKFQPKLNVLIRTLDSLSSL